MNSLRAMVTAGTVCLFLLSACSGDKAPEESAATDAELTPESVESTSADAAPEPEEQPETSSTAGKVAAGGAVGATSTTASPPELTGTHWKLVEIEDKAPEQEAGAKELYLVLNADDSTVSGYAGCNQLSGSYELEGSKLSFGPLAVTRMMCPEGMELEQQFLKVLEATTRVELREDRLALSTDRSQQVARFVAVRSK